VFDVLAGHRTRVGAVDAGDERKFTRSGVERAVGCSGSCATALGLDRSSVSGLVDRAVRRGLVAREAGRDGGRSVCASGPDAGMSPVTSGNTGGRATL
jgi:hypothetical protein